MKEPRRIFKYPLIAPKSHLNLPKDAWIMHVAEQGDDIQLWAMVDPQERETELRTFVHIATGQEFDHSEALNFVGTGLCKNGLVWHVFELNEEDD